MKHNEKGIRLSPENYITGYKKEHDHHLILCLQYKQTITMFNRKTSQCWCKKLLNFQLK